MCASLCMIVYVSISSLRGQKRVGFELQVIANIHINTLTYMHTMNLHINMCIYKISNVILHRTEIIIKHSNGVAKISNSKTNPKQEEQCWPLTMQLSLCRLHLCGIASKTEKKTTDKESRNQFTHLQPPNLQRRCQDMHSNRTVPSTNDSEHEHSIWTLNCWRKTSKCS